MTPMVGGFQAYFGGGVGGVAVVAGGVGGAASISLTVNALGGAYFPVSQAFAIYGQVKLLGVLDLTTMSINALLMPGLGLCVTF
ncbi:MAG: hypothetical protein ACPLRP_05985, partial [Candidatus Bipolaricaulaceae bacterium]